MLWAAASRAIRSPTPFDPEVIEKLGTVTYLAANEQFRPEEVRAYELGSRCNQGMNLCHNHDDIERSGVTSVPKALRLAPNLLVTQTSSSAYVLSARGFSGNPNS